MATFDMTYRDPNAINDHIKVRFEDVFAEPEGVRSINMVWQFTNDCYGCCLTCVYNVPSFFCGLCIALSWGCDFARVAMLQVWCCTPSLRMCAINFGACEICFGHVVNCFLVPLCQIFSVSLTRVRVRYK